VLDGNTQTLTNKRLTDTNCTFADGADLTKQMAFECSGISGGTTRTLTVPNASGTIALTSDIPAGLSDGDKGDITVSASGATWTIDNGAVTLAKQADMATASVVYRKTAGAGAPEVQTLATLKTDLGLTGTNSGDQDLSSYLTTAAAAAAYQPLDADLTTWAGITPGTGVGTALAVNVGTAGAFVTNGGALGTPSSGTATNLTGTASGLTAGNVTTNANLTGPVTSVGNATTITDAAVTLAKMANLAQDQFIGRTTASTGVPETATITAAARTVLDDATVGDMVNTLGGATSTGTGGLVRETNPTLVTPALGTPASGVLTNCTGQRVYLSGHSGATGGNITTAKKYWSLSGSTANGGTTVTQLTIPAPFTGTLTKFWHYSIVNPTPGDVVTTGFRNNTTASEVTTTYTSAGLHSFTGSLTVTEGDLITVFSQITTGSTTITLDVQSWSAQGTHSA